MTDGSSPASAVLKDGNAVYTPGLSERRGSASKFYHGDALGSTRGITDSTQAVTDSQLYDAFGNTVSRTGSTPTPFGFVGKSQYQSDSDSGLQLLGHRYYDPSIGRFLSQDPVKAGTNWYAYCDNNPLKSIDPEGLVDSAYGPLYPPGDEHLKPTLHYGTPPAFGAPPTFGVPPGYGLPPESGLPPSSGSPPGFGLPTTPTPKPSPWGSIISRLPPTINIPGLRTVIGIGRTPGGGIFGPIVRTLTPSNPNPIVGVGGKFPFW